MLNTFAIVAAMLGMLVIVSLILREVKSSIGGGERNMLLAGGVLVVVVGVWQAIAQAGASAH